MFKTIINNSVSLTYNLPEINLQHIKKLTTGFGMIQFAKINQPDLASGYTVDDNARALIAMCQHFELTRDKADIPYIHIYVKFIEFCQQHDGSLLNYVNAEKKFTAQNYETNLADSNGRSIWALGYLISLRPLLPIQLTALANRQLTLDRLQQAIANCGRQQQYAAVLFIDVDTTTTTCRCRRRRQHYK